MRTDVKRILLVEDDVRDAELTLNALADSHLANEVVLARDGAEALDYLYERGTHASRDDGHPVVVPLDLKLPKVDGLTVLRTMKSDPALQSVPVVVLTSSREERDLVDSYRLGVNACVVKPVEFGGFISAVKQVGSFWAVVNEPSPGRVRSGA
jgi:two-component system, response regulator